MTANKILVGMETDERRQLKSTCLSVLDTLKENIIPPLEMFDSYFPTFKSAKSQLRQTISATSWGGEKKTKQTLITRQNLELF